MHFVTYLNRCKNLDVSDNFSMSLETSMCILLISFYFVAIVAGPSV